MNKQEGFTLIELLVVIVILGILAATALPRFTGMQTDARIAKLNAARGSVLAASGLIHSKYMVKNGTADTANCPGGGGTATNTADGTVCTESGLIALANGYPRAQLPGSSYGGIVDAAGLVATMPATQAQLNAEGFKTYGGGGSVGDTIYIHVTGGTNADNCYFTYRAPTENGAAPVVSAVTTSGC